MMPRLRVYSVQDHFGPGLIGQPYWYSEVYDAAADRQLWAAGYGSWLEAMRGGLLALAEKLADVAESYTEWERGMAEQAMDAGPICGCGHGQLEHGETRCKHCACVLPWYAPEFARPSEEAST